MVCKSSKALKHRITAEPYTYMQVHPIYPSQIYVKNREGKSSLLSLDLVVCSTCEEGLFTIGQDLLCIGRIKQYYGLPR